MAYKIPYHGKKKIKKKKSTGERAVAVGEMVRSLLTLLLLLLSARIRGAERGALSEERSEAVKREMLRTKVALIL